jgi:hypothetical protein
MMYAALDRLEMVDENRAGAARWLGQLCPMEDCNIYGVFCGMNVAANVLRTKLMLMLRSSSIIYIVAGYVTPTNIKFLAMVQCPPSETTQSIRESELKLVFVSAALRRHDVFF